MLITKQPTQMNNSEIITRYFPEISDEQRRQFDLLGELYTEWNSRINVMDSIFTASMNTAITANSTAKNAAPIRWATAGRPYGCGG